MSSLEIINCAQGQPEWFAARLGLPTCSRFSDILAKGAGIVRVKYLRTLAAEIITGQLGESFTSGALERGHAMEAEIRRRYAFDFDVEPQLIGFVKNGRKGYSPDSFVGTNGLLEVKSQRADLLIETLEKKVFPSEHVAQTQGGLWVSEREYIDIAIGWLPEDREPGKELPVFVKRAYRDERYILNLKSEVDRFNDELDALVARIRRYGQPEAVAA